MKKVPVVLFVLLLSLSVFASDPIHTPGAKTAPPGSVDIDFDFHSVSSTLVGDSQKVHTDYVTLGISYVPIKRLELNGEFNIGKTSFGQRSATNAGNVALGVKYRLWRHSYEGGEGLFAVGYKVEIPTNQHQDLVNVGLPLVADAYTSLGWGVNHKTQFILSGSRNKLYVGGYGEYNLRTKSLSNANEIKLGNESRFGSVAYYTLTNIAKEPQLSLLVDVWWFNMQKAQFFQKPLDATGGNQLNVAPGAVLGITPKFSVKASWLQAVAGKMGRQVPTFKNGLMVGASYRF